MVGFILSPGLAGWVEWWMVRLSLGEIKTVECARDEAADGVGGVRTVPRRKARPGSQEGGEEGGGANWDFLLYTPLLTATYLR